ncbi:MAG: hypothetical protein J6W74_05815 [Bacteroidales bacterium]|nr:hypothetical protein [Bacteroidales bacterium]
MKRLLSILSAGVLALMAFSCTEEELATFDQSKIDAPILGSYDLTEEVLTVNFTPAVSSHDFNKNVPLNYALAFVSVDGKEVSKVIPATKVNGNVMTLTVNNLIKALAAYGYAPGDNANFELAVRATTQDLSKDTGINGYVDSEGHIKFVNYTLTEYVKPQQEDPYAGMTEASKWSVIGKIASTGNEWGNDEPMLTDGEWHLCRGIVLSTDDEFKFRFDGGWDTNFGLEGSDPVVVTLDEELTAVAGGANIKVPEDGTYDLLLNPESELIKVVQAVAAPDPYEQYSEDSTWSLIGAMSLYGYNWGDDIDMKTDGDEHIAIEVNLAAGDEVKFRNNHGWDENFGYAEGISSYELGEEIPVAQGGANIIIAETGVYNLFLLPDDAVARIEFVKEYSGDTPEPQEPDVNGVWTLVGDINGWAVDAGLASEDYGTWKLVQNVTIGTHDDNGTTVVDGVKWVMDAGWDVNFGLVKGEAFAGLDVEQDAAFGGDNIVVAEPGVYDFYLDPKAKKVMVKLHSDEPLPEPEKVKFYIQNKTGLDAINIWSWGGLASVVDGLDWPGLTLTETETVEEVTWYVVSVLASEVKGKDCGLLVCSTDGAWQTKDCTFTADETTTAYYFIAHEGETKVAVLERLGATEPEPEEPSVDGVWTLVGDINGWAADAGLASEDFGTWKLVKNVTIGTHEDGGTNVVDGVKWVMDGSWTVNFGLVKGAAFAGLDVEMDAEFGGDNIVVAEPGTYDFYLEPNAKKLMVKAHVEEEPATKCDYGLIGWHTADNWSTLVDMYSVSGFDGWFVAKGIGAKDGNISFKFRQGDDWNTQIAAVNKYNKTVNTKIALRAKDDSGDPSDITLYGDGTYDVYFNKDLMLCVILATGSTFAVPTEDESDPAVGGDNSSDWSIIGDAVGGWNNENDVKFDKSNDSYVYVTGVTLDGGKNFKFRRYQGWTYQLTQPGLRTIGERFDLVDGNGTGNDMQVENTDSYDVYLARDLSHAYIVKAGDPLPSGGTGTSIIARYLGR